MRVSRKDMERCCDDVCELLSEIHVNKPASRKQWDALWAALNRWRKASRQQSRKSNRGLSNKLAWNVCEALSRYDHRENKIARHECWSSIWSAFNFWDNDDSSNEERRRHFALGDVEAKRMDREFRDKVS